MAIDDSVDTLLYSDDPETVGEPPEGILFEHDVAGGRTRLLFYHVNGISTQRCFGVRIRNVGATTAVLRTRIAAREPMDHEDWAVTGHMCNAAFLRLLSAGGWSAQTTLPVNGELVLAPLNVKPQLLAAGYVEVDHLSAGSLRFTVVTAMAR